jgi:hypothetical protein
LNESHFKEKNPRIESSKTGRIGFKPAPEEPPKRFQNAKTKIRASLRKAKISQHWYEPDC